VVERDLAKVEVAGSTPVSRSSGVSLPTFPCQQLRFTFHLAHQARYPSGKGEVCKTFMRRFDPDPRLQSFQLFSHRDGVMVFVPCGEICGDPPPRAPKLPH
jgi:hypothetical protein